MLDSDPVKKTSYELPLVRDALLASAPPTRDSAQSLPEYILASNVLWFCRLRWIVISILLAFGVLGQFEQVIRRIGLCGPGLWPFVAGGILTLCNLMYLTYFRSSQSSDKPSGSVINLWAQIVLDLVVLTAVVHYLGSIRTYIPFTYLFHIVLVCVFFSRGQSLIVVLMASTMLGGCIVAERVGILKTAHIFTAERFAPVTANTSTSLLSFPSAIAIWLVVWYLASYLSKMVRVRDVDLAETNRRLVAAQEERSRHMLTMTHQLKAPFAAIHANAQLLLKGHCGALSEEALSVTQRIVARSRRLATEIQEMLQLANLSSDGQRPPRSTQLDLSAVLNWCVDQIRPLAQERGIPLQIDIGPARTHGIEDHMKMLLSNLLFNAVVYSLRGSAVRVRCRHEPGSPPVVVISDQGIGICADKLPRIFDEHYRTKEAVQHNKESSGLGLSIVRHVAELHGIRLRVESRPGTGTIFTLRFSCDAVDSSAPRRKDA